MERFARLVATAVPLPEADLDTDIIFPARFLLHTEKAGLGAYAFYERRYDGEGRERPEFPLNQPAYGAAKILVAGRNFGGGSSREHAVWALHDLGFRCVIAPSFGEIFFANALKNGLLPVRLSAAEVASLTDDARAGAVLTVDLAEQVVVRSDGGRLAFEVPAWRRAALLNGWDDVDLILNDHAADIAAFETRDRVARPWLHAPLPL